MDELIGIKDVVQRFLNKTKIAEANEADFIMEKWKDLAGEETAAYTEPFKYEKGKLFIKVTNSVMNAELQYKKEKLRKKINQIFKEEKIKEVITRIGK